MNDFFMKWDGLVTLIAFLFTIFILIKKIATTSPAINLFFYLLACAGNCRLLYSYFYPETLIWWVIVFILPLFLSRFIHLIYLFLFLK
jgi:hypothetical protein